MRQFGNKEAGQALDFFFLKKSKEFNLRPECQIADNHSDLLLFVQGQIKSKGVPTHK